MRKSSKEKFSFGRRMWKYNKEKFSFVRQLDDIQEDMRDIVDSKSEMAAGKF